jgi:hypothetical protein
MFSSGMSGTRSGNAYFSKHPSHRRQHIMTTTFPGTSEITTRLDELEARLPTVPARILKLQRTVAAANYDRTVAAFTAVASTTKTFLDTAAVSGKTVTGQARAAANDVVATLRTGINTVTGQAAAQGKKVATAAETQATKLVDEAIDAVEDAPSTGTPYEQWTKAELVERAKELQIVGPTRMSKAELIAALRAA